MSKEKSVNHENQHSGVTLVVNDLCEILCSNQSIVLYWLILRRDIALLSPKHLVKYGVLGLLFTEYYQKEAILANTTGTDYTQMSA